LQRSVAVAGPLFGMLWSSDVFSLLQVHAIELDASAAALAALRVDSRTYVEAQITLHFGATPYGPYRST
jgi:hypothetical protein